TVTLWGLDCDLSMSGSGPESRLYDSVSLIAAAQTWVSETYPDAVGDDGRLSPPDKMMNGKRYKTTVMSWQAPDSLRVSMAVSYVDADERPTPISLDVS